MKKLLLIAFILTGCSATSDLAGVTEYRGYDFTDYTEQGFLITPEGYDGEYESIGVLTVRMSPEASKTSPQGDMIGYDIKKDSGGFDWWIQRISVQDAIDRMHELATEMGADAIIRFDASGEDFYHGTLPLRAIDVTGFAIRRTP